MNRRFALRTIAGILLWLGFVALLGSLFREELETWGTWFTGRFGVVGMAAGTFLAEAVQFPVPPQFYMLASVTGGFSSGVSFAAIALGSLAGGAAAMLGARRLMGWHAFRSRLEAGESRFDEWLGRYGKKAIWIGSVSPLPFSMMCIIAGIYRVPRSWALLLFALRVPRLMVFFLAIRAGWGLATRL